jgi:hypothetical protein
MVGKGTYIRNCLFSEVMDKEPPIKRYPHLNLNAVKALYTEDGSKKPPAPNPKVPRKNKKRSKAEQQRQLLFGNATASGGSDNNSDDITDVDPVSDKSDYETVPDDDLNTTTDVDDVENSEEAEVEEEPSIYPQPVAVIDSKKTAKDSVVIGLPLDAQFFFKGSLQIRVLKGCLEVFGHRLSAGMETAAKVYSPRGSSLLSLKAVQQASDGDTTSATEDVRGDCVFVARKLSESWMDYVQTRMKKSWKLGLFGRDQDREEGELEGAEAKLKELEKTLNITLIDPLR